MDSYKGSYLDLPDEVFQPSEGQAGGWSLQEQQHGYRPENGSTEASRNVYPETSRNGSGLILHNGYVTNTRPPYFYPPASIAGPNTPNKYADSQMVIARTSSSSSLMSTSESYGSPGRDSQMMIAHTSSFSSTSESYGSPGRRFDLEPQLQQAPVYQPFFDNFGPATHDQDMPATLYQTTVNSRNSGTGNFTTPIEASYSIPTTHSTHKVLSELELRRHDSLRAQDNKAKSTLRVVDDDWFKVFRESNRPLSFKLDGEPHNNLSVSIGDKTEISEELVQDLQGINTILPSTVDVTLFSTPAITQLNHAGELINNYPLNQALAILQNGGSTNLIQPMKQPPHTEQDSFPSQPCTHCGRYDNHQPEPQVSTPILLWEQFRKKLKAGELSLVLSEIAIKATSRKNFAAVLNRRIFSEEERRVSNVSGTKGKKKLNPDLIGVIKENVFRYWPFEPGKLKITKIKAWRDCIIAIDTANRQLKHR